MESLELDDIQGNILRPYAMPCVRYLFLEFTDGKEAREFVRRISARLTSAAPWTTKPTSTLNFALSFAGLTAMGVDGSTLCTFPQEFSDGMASRADVLGDLGVSAPKTWDAPLGTSRVSAVAIVYGLSTKDREERVAWVREQLKDLPHVAVVLEHSGSEFGHGNMAREHFGFNDGIGQPSIDKSPAPVYPGDGTPSVDPETKKVKWTPVATGTVFLNYSDAYGANYPNPDPLEVRANGTYFVYRKLKQDVLGFRKYIADNARVTGGDPELLAAKMMGRWRSGAPLALSPTQDNPALAQDPEKNNNFTYGDDPAGLKCPRGSHIRRANPRDDLLKDTADDKGDPLVHVAAHRIVRRSIPYGGWLGEDVDDGKQRGLLFSAFNTNLVDQFEFIQGSWLNSGNVDGGTSADADPFCGSPMPRTAAGVALSSTYRIPQSSSQGSSCAVLFDLPRFVTVKGGEYFFMPGIRALSVLAREPAPKPAPAPLPDPSNFLAKYDAIAKTPGLAPEQIAVQQASFVRSMLAPPFLYEMCAQLRTERPVFCTPAGVFVTRFRDVEDVLSTNDVFSVRATGAKMNKATGPFMLGMDDSDVYQHQLAMARMAVRRDDMTRLLSRTNEVCAGWIATAKASKRIDAIQQLANRVPVTVMGEYFGIPGPSDDLIQNWFATTSLYIFNFWSNTYIANLGESAAIKINTYLQGLIEARKAYLSKVTPGPDDVLGRLLAMQNDSTANVDDADVRNVIGGTYSGALIPTAALFAKALDRLMDLKEQRPDLFATLKSAAMSGDRKLVQDYVIEAARFDAYPTFLVREATRDYVLSRGTPHETTVPAGSTVIVVLSSAMRDAEVVEEPETFRLGRPDWQILLFGHNLHVCLGEFIGRMLMTEMARALFALPGIRRAEGPAGTLRYGAPDKLPDAYFAQSFVLEFD